MSDSIPVETFAGIGNIMKRRWVAADEREVFLRHTEERRHFAARCFLAVEAMTIRDEFRVFVEFELHHTAGTPAGVFLCHEKFSFAPHDIARASWQDRFITSSVDALRGRPMSATRR